MRRYSDYITVRRTRPNAEEGKMTRYQIHFSDERGVQELELDDVQLEGGIYELWRGEKAIERIPADQIDKIESNLS
jgi:hypothetical protein